MTSDRTFQRLRRETWLTADLARYCIQIALGVAALAYGGTLGAGFVLGMAAVAVLELARDFYVGDGATPFGDTT